MPGHPLPGAETAKAWWSAMLLMRRFEERCGELYASGAIGGFLHSARGEEAVVAGAAAALAPDDAVLSTFRSHAWALARGTPPYAVFAELLGRVGGTSGGRGGSTHVVDPGHGVYGGFGIPAGHAPLSAGLALSFALRSEPRVALCQLTLGATAEGVFAETLALAASWSLPVVFLVTSDGSAPDPLPAVTDLFQRSAAFGVSGLRCSGADPAAVHATLTDALARARARRPMLVEALVQRSGPEAIDPVEVFADRLSPADRAAIDATVGGRLDLALAEAQASPEPEPAA